MEIRVLNYFLTIAREQSFSKAAQILNVTQPTLSRQIKELEDEYHITLFDRTTRTLSLTEEGLLFKEQAKQIIRLVEKMEAQLRKQEVEIAGEIHIGCSESKCNRIVMKAIARAQKAYPHIKFRITSGNAQYVTEMLDQGLLDLGIVVDPANMSKYDYIRLPDYDTRGVLMRKDSDLAKLDAVSPSDLIDKPVIISSQEMVKNEIAGWLGGNQRALNVVATFNLFYNAKLMAEERVGYVLTLDSLYHESEDSILCFKPLKPKLTIRSNVIWKKYKLFPKAVEVFLEMLNQEISANNDLAG
jgi:DNA-binding transcriptional LysR family regulator